MEGETSPGSPEDEGTAADTGIKGGALPYSPNDSDAAADTATADGTLPSLLVNSDTAARPVRDTAACFGRGTKVLRHKKGYAEKVCIQVVQKHDWLLGENGWCRVECVFAFRYRGYLFSYGGDTTAHFVP